MEAKRRESSAADRTTAIIGKGLEYKLKAEKQREARKDRELDGCTFVP
jgi:hypothetical protein